MRRAAAVLALCGALLLTACQVDTHVTVEVDDTSVGGAPDVSADFTLGITDVNEAPTGVSFSNTTPSLAENTDVSAGIKVADIDVTDDALGTNDLDLTGADANAFQIHRMPVGFVACRAPHAEPLRGDRVSIFQPRIADIQRTNVCLPRQ